MQTLDKKGFSGAVWLLLFLFIGIIAWAANPWDLYFINDDFIHIPKASDGTIGHNNAARHINDLSLYLDSLWSKKSAFGYHLTNLLLHIFNLLLSIVLLKKIVASYQKAVPDYVIVLMVCLFGVYAFHSEALFWILCRTASLSMFFNLICWICFFKCMQNRWWLVPMCVSFLLGIFTYESLFVFPVWLLIWLFTIPKNAAEKRLSKIPMIVLWILFIAYFPVRVKITGELLGTYEAKDIQEFHLFPLIENSFKLFTRSFLPPMLNTKLFLTFFAIIMMAVAYFSWKLIKRKKVDNLLIFFVLSWLISYFPYVSLGISTTGYESERYLYYPSFFLCISIIYAGYLLFQQDRIKMYSYLMLIFCFHLFFFVKSAVVFKAIGGYSKSAIVAIQKVPMTKGIVIKDLPVYSNGLPIFDYGFDKALAWQVPGRDSNNVQVISRKHFVHEQIGIQLLEGPSNDTLIFY